MVESECLCPSLCDKLSWSLRIPIQRETGRTGRSRPSVMGRVEPSSTNRDVGDLTYI